MLTLLSIRNYAIVDQLELELNRGMTVVSGETGAGKSIMLDALGLSLGARAQSDCVREGTDRAEITACFDIRNLSEARDWLAEHELEGDEECQLRRVITREGRSRSFINGRPTPLTQVRELGQLLVNIHGQHEHQRLLKKDHHRTLLDEYAGQAELAEQVRAAYQRWRRLYGELTQLTELSTEQSARGAAAQLSDRGVGPAGPERRGAPGAGSGAAHPGQRRGDSGHRATSCWRSPTGMAKGKTA